MSPQILNLNRLIRFASIGGLAALVHFSAVLVLVEYYQQPLLIANIFAFCLAFVVSYCGQSYWTFAGHQRQLQITLWRYALIASLGFCMNESSVWFCVYVLGWRYQPSLILAIGLAAVSTYLLSQHWVFKPA